jgi:hypothetical protein
MTAQRAYEEHDMTTSTDTMKAAAIDRFGGPDELTLHTLSIPDIGADEVTPRQRSHARWLSYRLALARVIGDVVAPGAGKCSVWVRISI